jgi:S-adenosylmethionine hydrolase
VRTFAEAKPSELVILVDSYGMCALALDQRAAATQLKLRAGHAVTIVTPDGDAK